ncbi:TetR/AcrR family transcriptional regulator [Undibacterium danionis]|uniref:TetR/AcrR family transcriptional regulator n=1 Tax=Undibacterium danionis TaxID=1812100 RepID=A0ABV6IDH9_9BURK
MSTPLRQTDRKRSAILQAAIAEFRSNGFEATSMDKIAASAEVSKRTVYNHFPSKEDLFAAILMHLWESAAAQNEFTYQKDRTLKVQLHDFLNKKMQMMCDQDFMDLVRVAVAATIHTPERARDMVDKLSQREEGIVAWIKAAQADKKLKAGDAILMGDMLQGQLKSLAFWPQIAMGQPLLNEAQQKKIIQLTADMFLQYYEK